MEHIAAKNIAATDLNLLLAFEAMLDEQNVTRAGQRIGLAQPSMSSALRRLRELFGDELFRRDGRFMRPTPRASQLAEPIREALRHVRIALAQVTNFEPERARYRFRLAVTDYGDFIVMPLLVRELRARASGADIEVRPIVDAKVSLEQLEKGEVDAMIGGHLPLPRDGVRQRLFEERFVCLCDAEKGLVHETMDLAAYAARPHALFSAVGGDGAPAALDAILLRQGLRRRVVATLPHVMALPFVIAGTDLVAALAERVAHRLAAPAGIKVLPLPCEVSPFAIDLLHTRRATTTDAVRWLLGLITEIGGQIDQATSSGEPCSPRSRHFP